MVNFLLAKLLEAPVLVDDSLLLRNHGLLNLLSTEQARTLRLVVLRFRQLRAAQVILNDAFITSGLSGFLGLALRLRECLRLVRTQGEILRLFLSW